MTRLNRVLDPSRTGKEAEGLEANLKRLIVGQDEAIGQIVNIYQMHLTQMNPPGRPIGNFLFLGPTGSGKTRIVEATSESLVGTPRGVIKIDCAEFQHSHEIAKLIGSPPGYLGHRETHPLLSQEVINQHHNDRFKVSFILFDEIEKASDALWNLLLGILDKATLTLGDNRKVDFSRAMIFMTSNLGASEMSSIVSPRMGFLPTANTLAPAAAVSSPIAIGGVAGAARADSSLSGKISRVGVEAARRKFTPEFMNRLDKIVCFKPLSEADLKRILEIELKMVQARIFQSSTERAFIFTITDAAKAYILGEGIDPKYGARHLKRAIERILVQPISNLMATNQVLGGDWVRVDYDPELNRVSFLKEAEGMSAHAMSQMADVSLYALATAVGHGGMGGMLESARMPAARSSRR